MQMPMRSALAYGASLRIGKEVEGLHRNALCPRYPWGLCIHSGKARLTAVKTLDGDKQPSG